MHPLPQVAFAPITISPWQAMLGCARLFFYSAFLVGCAAIVSQGPAGCCFIF